MDRTGLLADIIAGVAAIYQGRQWLDTEGFEGAGRISYNDGLSIALDTFCKALSQADSDLEGLILYESAFLVQELQFCAVSDKVTISSLTNAIQSFDDALRALKIVDIASSYKIAEQTYPQRGDYRHNGMPKDAFHIACEAHKTRLNNILRSPGINLKEKELLKTRLKNISVAQNLYLKKQKKALLGE